MPKKSPLSPEQRTQLVLRLLRKEEPAAQIARRAGVAEQTLYRWREEFLTAGQQALKGGGQQAEQGKEVERLKAQVAEREQVIGELTIANRVLKKLAGRSNYRWRFARWSARGVRLPLRPSDWAGSSSGEGFPARRGISARRRRPRSRAGRRSPSLSPWLSRSGSAPSAIPGGAINGSP